jgi:uncharacterized membrane protein
MFTFLYYVAAIVCFVFYVGGWPNYRNKLIPIAGFIITFIPLLNLIAAALLLRKNWPTIKKVWNEVLG